MTPFLNHLRRRVFHAKASTQRPLSEFWSTIDSGKGRPFQLCLAWINIWLLQAFHRLVLINQRNVHILGVIERRNGEADRDYVRVSIAIIRQIGEAV